MTADVQISIQVPALPNMVSMRVQRLRPVTVKAPWPPHLQSHQHTDTFLQLYSFRFSIFLNLLYFMCLRLLPAYI